ncbi:MAG: CPBP family glutamic-type intramembrane protease [Propionibacteriaceae bacterium]|nr:CPBP family glutamic-type intramembrane protease [Propionibacteriaceae bacterium]
MLNLAVLILHLIGIYQAEPAWNPAGIVRALATARLAACTGEIRFRTGVPRPLNNRFGAVPAVIATSLIFGVAHLQAAGSRCLVSLWVLACCST